MMEGSRTYLTQPNEGFFARRSTIEKQLIVCCLILAVVVLGLVIAVSVLAGPRRDRQPDKDTDVIIPEVGKICLKPGCVRAASQLLDSINTSVDPCTDFYSFVCDGWKQKHPLPDDKGKFGSFDILANDIITIYKSLLTNSNVNSGSTAINKTRMMYKLCLNEELIWNKTLPDVKATLKRLGGWPLITPDWTSENFDWMKIEAEMNHDPPTSVDPMAGLVEISVSFNERNTSENAIILDQPILAVPREFLLNPQNYSDQIKAYATLIKQVAKFLGNLSDEDIRHQVANLLILETKIAENSMAADAKRRVKFHTNLTVGQLDSQSKNKVDWLRLLQLIFENITDIKPSEEVFLYDDHYIDKLGDIINSTDKKTLANYMLWHYILPLLMQMSKETENYYFQFAKVMTGVTRSPERWKMCILDMDKSLGMGLGRLFVDHSFQADNKQQAKTMIEEIKETFIEMLQEVDWMDDVTKKAAIEKAKNMSDKIGYPEWILNNTALDDYYKNVTILDEDYWHNLKSAAKVEATIELESLRQRPVDKSRWYMTPGTVNAYYLPELNSINFPAGILQNPFYMTGRPMAMNFGGIGSVIGHEITHGFDDEGRLHDKSGALENWWSDNAVENFKTLSNCYVDQYHEFCPKELEMKVCVNGNNTLGENIADNGGLKASFKAYKKWIKKNGEEARLPGLQQYNLDQIFFISFGQLWCSNSRPETLLNLILKDPHSPSQYRVLGTVANSEEFSKAFNCPQNSPLNRQQKCHLW